MSLLIQKLIQLFVLILLSMHIVHGFSTRHVNILNSLENNLYLTVHCKSKDDDLGFHLLQNGQSYSFQFDDNFFGTTQYFCSFRWPSEFYYFDIYIFKRDDQRCVTCNWSIKKSGPCLNLPDKPAVCYGWNQ
jgi:hypothetical protein